MAPMSATKAKMITGIGTGPTKPWPSTLYWSRKALMGCPPDQSSAAPRKADIPPKVTMNGGTLSLLTPNP